MADRSQKRSPKGGVGYAHRLIQTRVRRDVADEISRRALLEGMSVATYVRRLLIQHASQKDT